MKDYKLSELKEICKNSECKVCEVKWLCHAIEYMTFSDLQIDTEEKENDDERV